MKDEKTQQVVDASELIQDDHNFNKGTEEGNQLLHTSLEKYGAGRSVLIDKDNRIIAGNKTQQQAADLGMKVRIIETDGTELIAVKRTDISLDSKEGREMALLDNRTSQVNLAWDETELAAVSESMDGFDASDWGMTFSELPGSVTENSSDLDLNNVEDDNFDEEKEEINTICEPGDIWQLGNHRLMCGDSTNAADVALLMQGEQADLWLTDPPYNVAYEGKTKDALTIKNDKMTDEQYQDFLFDAFTAANYMLKPGCPFYVWTAQGHSIADNIKALDKVGLIFKQQIIWVKNRLVLGHMDYHCKHEPCLYGWKDGAAHYFIKKRNRTTVYSDGEEINIDKMKREEMKALLHQILDEKEHVTVIDCPKPQRSDVHPTMKPVRLFVYLMQNSSRQNDIILDTFGGSGTTIVACEQLHRKARLMELDPHYCDVIIARWEKLTGGKAEKISNVGSHD